jgi:hypothetical protein
VKNHQAVALGMLILAFLYLYTVMYYYDMLPKRECVATHYQIENQEGEEIEYGKDF